MITIAFQGELNGFLAISRRHCRFRHVLYRRAGLKDVIEALGVPHTEVGAIDIDGMDAGLDRVVDDDSMAAITVWPNARGHRSALRPVPPAPPRFVLDGHLGRLARYLRLLGFDTRYANDCDDATLAYRAATETRILLTRDRGLLKRTCVVFGRFIRADDPFAQLADVFMHFELRGWMTPFTRCSHCNALLEEVDKADIIDQLEPGTRRHYDRFRRCPDCRRLFWRGSHHETVQGYIDTLLRHLD